MPFLIKPWIFRYLDKNGKRVPKGTPGAKRVKERARKWYGCGIPGQKQRVPLASDKEAAKQMLANMVRKAERGEAGISDPFDKHRLRPLAKHLADFQASMTGKGATGKQIKLKIGRIRRLIEKCAFETANDLDSARVEAFLAEMRQQGRALAPLDVGKDFFTRDEVAAVLNIKPASVKTLVSRQRLEGIGQGKARRYPRTTVETLYNRLGRGPGIQTANYYLREIKSFCRWLVREKRLPDNPLAHLSGGNPKMDRRHDRQTLTPEQLTVILETARTSTRIYRGLSGEDRHMLYLTACATGFRAAELAALTPKSFDLDASPPTVILPARLSKNRRGAKQPIAGDVADALRGYLSGRPVGKPIWAGTWKDKGAEMLRIDLEAAGIPYEVEGPDGPLYADFHSLRHSFIALLDRAGVSLKEAMQLARHSDPKLTMARYGRAQLHDLGAAVERMPSLVREDPAGQQDEAAIIDALAVLGMVLADVFLSSRVAHRVAPTFETDGDKPGQTEMSQADTRSA